MSESSSSSSSSSSPSAPVQQIPGYQLLAKVGKGGMGTVYKAKQISLDREVAIKVLPKKYAHNTKFIESLYAEGKAAAKLNHPNIVGALDVGQAGEIHYFVMEFVEGTTVYDELIENIRYDEQEAIPIILSMARALDHAHKAGIVHRDVKPQNMMLTAEGVAKLADMGLARGAAQTDDEVKAGQATGVMGSPFYMSPEQILNKPDVDFRTDIYSLGASLYYMLLGKPPFDEPTAQAVMKAHLRKPLVPLHKADSRISDGVSQIVEVCLAKVKEDRYSDTASLVEDLEAVAEGGLPLHAAAKLGVDEFSIVDGLDEGEDAIGKSLASASSASGGGSEASTSSSESDSTSSGGISAKGNIIRPSHVVPRTAAPIQQERSFWLAVVGWGAAIVLGVLYWMK